ncbi:MAG: RNA-binding S4 domain-containing protein [Bacteroidetes bacterium]|nr:RNA-binding S4 domain-containing protein [Bacteroidota bacterium]MDA0903197.1 RNA-binding S4 domain-containing protein [Bacteroidota bacterium]MDA1242244.1 RNA-binding S4 domain-containing protein [Bacteroidota bacterium]
MSSSGSSHSSTPPSASVFNLHTEFIDLLQFLKATGMAVTGGEAKAMVDEGCVRVNGEPESRRRRKLRMGDRIEVSLDTSEHWVIGREAAP